MIEIKKLNKYYNRFRKNELHVINNISLSLENQGLVALLGPSGSGKTTLLNAIGGLDKVKSGKIYIDNKKITSKFARKVDKIRNLNIGYIFQDYKLIDNISVFDNVAIVLKMIGIKDKKEIQTRVNYVLEKTGMYRYRNRPAAMLSGGERQRVGIARAIVKNPNIIIADEPTGNLDSKNSLEIMNIIKAISREKLVILVTHEKDLAKFYATRIIEIMDGVVQKDYLNEHEDELDYQVENTIYLKDMKKHENIDNDNLNIDFYSDKAENINLQVVVKNGNIYIKTNSINKLEVIDESSSIELVDEHYQKINKEDVEKYQFNFKDVINENIRKRYASILNPITTITGGFKKVFEFSVLKKILLLGFIASSMFTMYAVSSITATLKVEDKDFIKYNKNYLNVKMGKVAVDEYLKYESNENINYLIPGDSAISLKIKYDEFYQTSLSTDNLNGSLSSLEMINKENLISGRMPENEYEIVVDKLAIDNVINSEQQYAKMAGLTKTESFLNKELSTATASKMKSFKIVGIVDMQSPSIYVERSMFINLMEYSINKNYDSYSNVHYFGNGMSQMSGEESTEEIVDYKLVENDIKLKKGRMPVNDYEVIVNNNKSYEMPLNKEINVKVNEKKLKVVGYYESAYNYDYYLVSNNTIKYDVISKSEGFVAYAKDKQLALQTFQGESLNVKDSYESSKDDYLRERSEGTKGALIFAGVILVISLIEIYLIIRASFLSRIKEIGILRAIGVKKRDIYKMFAGEILAITTLTSLPGIALMSYILKTLSSIKYLEGLFIINNMTVLGTIAFVYIFNLVIGLLPVFNVIRKRPAEILSRNDL